MLCCDLETGSEGGEGCNGSQGYNEKKDGISRYGLNVLRKYYIQMVVDDAETGSLFFTCADDDADRFLRFCVKVIG